MWGGGGGGGGGVGLTLLLSMKLFFCFFPTHLDRLHSRAKQQITKRLGEMAADVLFLAGCSILLFSVPVKKYFYLFDIQCPSKE